MVISELLRSHTEDFCAREGISRRDVNGGLCDAWAEEAADLLAEQGIGGEVYADGNFQHPEGFGAWDAELLAQHWPECVPPAGFVEHEVDMAHYWLFVPSTGMHYDAECLEGVRNFFDLPIALRRKTALLERLQLSPASSRDVDIAAGMDMDEAPVGRLR